MRHVPVLIVGGGPIGLGLAADLGWRGIECLMVEQGDGTIYHPRANTVNSRTMEFCRRWGVAEKVREAGAPPDFPPTILYLTGLQGYEIARIERPTHGGRKPLPTTPERSQRCNQLWFDPILRELASGFDSVTLRYNCRFDRFTRDGDGVIAELHDMETGETETVETDFLVACCGGQSMVRKALNVTMEGIPVLSHHLNVFLRIPQLWEHHDKGKAAFHFMIGTDGVITSLIDLDGNELWRLNVNLGIPRTDPETVDVDDIVKRLIGPHIPYEVVSALPWTCRSILADRWSDGPVFLAGDAVHQHSPAGGFGMNTGMGDAVDLGWKLAATLDGWGGPGLLASYEAERRPVAGRNVGEATENARTPYETENMEALEDATPEGKAVRRRLGEFILGTKTKQFVSDGIALGYRYDPSPVVVPDGAPPPPAEAGEYRPTTYPGSRAPHALLADGTSTIDMFGRGFVLMAFDGADTGALVEAAASRGVPLRVEAIDDPAIATLYERRLVLVRPDGHVAWRADALPDDAGEIIDRARGSA